MKKLLQLVAAAVAVACVGSVIGQVIVVGVIWLKGGLTAEKRFRILAVMYDVDLASMRQQAISTRHRQTEASWTVESRAKRSPELLIRDESLRQSQGMLLTLDTQLREEQRQRGLRGTDFDAFLANLETQVLEQSLSEVRRTVESMKSKQAKTQLLRMLDAGAMNDVVQMIKAMPLDKRKKILSEFKAPAEAERLHEILQELRAVADSSSEAGSEPL